MEKIRTVYSGKENTMKENGQKKHYEEIIHRIYLLMDKEVNGFKNYVPENHDKETQEYIEYMVGITNKLMTYCRR